jgi:phosphofructokinase-like protein
MARKYLMTKMFTVNVSAGVDDVLRCRSLPPYAASTVTEGTGEPVARIGILTGGGDCPGLNAVIRAVVRKGVNYYGHAIVGYRDGWRGVLENRVTHLAPENTSGILPRGGTILGSSRTNPFKEERGIERVKESLEEERIEALIVVGGEDTLGVADKLTSEGVRIVGVPKTIDNDLSATDFTFGFHTAVQICTDAIDRLHSTAESHNRVIVLEVMGRHTGWIATYAGIAGGADEILVPERPFSIDSVCEHIRHRHRRGRTFSIVVVAEGAIPADGEEIVRTQEADAFGHVRLGGIGVALEQQIEQNTGYETRVTILGHIQRGGTPTAFDRVLATRFGIAAIDAVADADYGKMVALRGTEIVRTELSTAVGELKTLDPALFETAEVFFG